MKYFIMAIILFMLCGCRHPEAQPNTQTSTGALVNVNVNIHIQYGDNTYDQSKETVLDNIVESITGVFQ